jgi:DNA-binding transcriptional ArsR family regulator
MTPSALFLALADPTRRSIFELITRRPSSVRELTDQVSVSQPAVSQHLKVLREAGLAHSEPDGARTIYSADPAGLDALRTWLDSMWDDVLDAYVDAAEMESSS